MLILWSVIIIPTVRRVTTKLDISNFVAWNRSSVKYNKLAVAIITIDIDFSIPRKLKITLFVAILTRYHHFITEQVSLLYYYTC